MVFPLGLTKKTLQTGGGGAAGSGWPPLVGDAAGSEEPPTSDGVAAIGDVEVDKMHYFKKDAIGRTYEHDEYDKCLFTTPLHGSLRSPTILWLRRLRPCL